MNYRHIFWEGAGDQGGTGSGGGAGAAGGGDQGGAAGAGGQAGGDQVTWPSNWRETFAPKGPDGKPDSAELKRLERFTDPTKVYSSYREIEGRLSKGELRSQLPKDAKPEQIAAWRAENGIPDTPDKYTLKLGEGRVVGEDDKVWVDMFLKNAHQANVTHEQASKVVDAYYQLVDTQLAEQAKMDKEFAANTQTELRTNWGSDFQRNMSVFHAALDGAPEGVKEKILAGRGPTGLPLGADPAIIKWVVDTKLQLDPATTLVGAGTGREQMLSIESELAKINKTMREDQKSYINDPAMQARWRELDDAMRTMKSRSG